MTWSKIGGTGVDADATSDAEFVSEFDSCAGYGTPRTAPTDNSVKRNTKRVVFIEDIRILVARAEFA